MATLLTSVTLALAMGCAGRATDDGNGSAAGSANEPGGGHAGAAGGTCLGTLAEVNTLGGPPCPNSLCAANAWASDCVTLPSEITGSYTTDCEDIQRITLEQAGAVSKVCYYRRGELSEPQLFAAEAWDDTRSACIGLSGHIATDGVPASCLDNGVMPLCDRTSHPIPQPANGCFDAFSSACAPCCPTTQPDCSVEPDGYPPNGCSPSSGSYCSCLCSQGKWSCAC